MVETDLKWLLGLDFYIAKEHNLNWGLTRLLFSYLFYMD